MNATPVPEVVAHVAEHHRLHVDRRAEVVGDPVEVPVVRRALAVPGLEDGADGGPQLVVRVLGKPGAGVALHDRPVLADQLLERRRVEVRVALHLLTTLRRIDGVLEELAVDAEHDPAEHLDEPAIGVQSETAVLGELGEPLERCGVEAEVEDGVHHPGHREAGTASHADQQRIARVAEALAGCPLNPAKCFLDLLPEPVGELAPAREVVVARLRRDRESGRHRQSRAGHLGHPGALAAEQVAHRGAPLVEAIHPFVRARPPGAVVLGRAAAWSGSARRRFRRLPAPGAHRHWPDLTVMVVAREDAPLKG